MILAPGVVAAALLVSMPSPTVDLDDETYLFEYDIGPRYNAPSTISICGSQPEMPARFKS